MRRAIMAAMIVVVLAITAIPIAESDAADQTTIRWSNNNLYHMTAQAVTSDSIEVSENGFQVIWIYAAGADSSMKAFIADPYHGATPDGGLRNVVEGTTYEIYYLNSFSYWYDFDNDSGELVLGSLSYRTHVNDNSVVVLTLVEIISVQLERSVMVYTLGAEGLDYYGYLLEGDNIKLNYVGDSTDYYLSGSSPGLFTEAVISQETKTFEGSPILYIALSAAVVGLVGLTMFLCGRKPNNG